MDVHRGILCQFLGLECTVCVFALVVCLLGNLVFLNQRSILKPSTRRKRIWVHCAGMTQNKIQIELPHAFRQLLESKS